MIGIHHRKGSFSSAWIEYCKRTNIPYKIVDCYSPSVLNDLQDCDALMWHYHHAHVKDAIIAKELLYSLEHSGKVVFPDFKTAWHFDDKVGQKYLLEALDIPVIKSQVFLDKKEALEWISKENFPKVFKLRSGSGAAFVKLLKSKKEAVKYIKKGFGSGFRHYDRFGNLKERWRKYRLGMADLPDVLKGLGRLFYTTDFDRFKSRERGYVYFQDFIPENKFDIRVVVIGKRAFAIKRFVRKDDFRASGSGLKALGKDEFNDALIGHSFNIAKKIESQCIAFDFLYENDRPLLIEMSYGFMSSSTSGYWDSNLNWHQTDATPQEWMVDVVLNEIEQKRSEQSL